MKRNRIIDWRNSTRGFEDKLRFLFESGLFSDVKISIKYVEDDIAKQQTFNVHSLLLLMASPVFEPMLTGNYREKDCFVIEDIDVKAFRIFLKYIYFEVVEITSVKEAWDLYYISTKYLVGPLQKECIGYIRGNSNVSTAAWNYNYAEFYELGSIKQLNYKILLNHLPQIFAQSSFLELSRNAIEQLLDEKTIPATETELFLNLEKWINAQAAKKVVEEREQTRMDLSKLYVSKVKFLDMSLSDFTETAGKSDLLTDTQKESILMNINNSKGTFPLAEGISYKKRIRSFDCECKASGLDCSLAGLEINNVQFNGKGSFVKLNDDYNFGEVNTDISFYFKINSTNENGTIFYAEKVMEDTTVHFKVSVVNGYIQINYTLVSVEYPQLYYLDQRTYVFEERTSVINNQKVNDNEPHALSMHFYKSNMTLAVDSDYSSRQFDWGPTKYTSPTLGYLENPAEFNWCLSSLFIFCCDEVDVTKAHLAVHDISPCYCDIRNDCNSNH